MNIQNTNYSIRLEYEQLTAAKKWQSQDFNLFYNSYATTKASFSYACKFCQRLNSVTFYFMLYHKQLITRE